MTREKRNIFWLTCTGMTFLILSGISLWSQQKGKIIPESNVPLIEALREGDLIHARKLVRSGAKLNVIDNYGDTPLLQAIRNGFTDFAEELLSSGADPKFPDESSTSLITAAWYCDLRITRKLLDMGVLVNGTNVQGETPLMSASQTCPDGKIVQMLLDVSADPNAKSKTGSTALMWAASGGNAIAAKKLLKAGADPSAKDNDGKTAADDACGRSDKGHSEVCLLLQQRAGEEQRLSQ